MYKFRHLLERTTVGKNVLSAMNGYQVRKAIKIRNGALLDAAIISAPSSRNDKDGQRDSEIHQTAPDKQWLFEMKVHVAFYSRSKLIQAVYSAAANRTNSLALVHLLRGKEDWIWGCRACHRQMPVVRSAGCRARDCTYRRYSRGVGGDRVVTANHCPKYWARIKVKHSIVVIERQIGLREMRCRGSAKKLH